MVNVFRSLSSEQTLFLHNSIEKRFRYLCEWNIVICHVGASSEFDYKSRHRMIFFELTLLHGWREGSDRVELHQLTKKKVWIFCSLALRNINMVYKQRLKTVAWKSVFPARFTSQMTSCPIIACNFRAQGHFGSLSAVWSPKQTPQNNDHWKARQRLCQSCSVTSL